MLNGQRPVLMFSEAESKYHNYQSLFKSVTFLWVVVMSTFGIDTEILKQHKTLWKSSLCSSHERCTGSSNLSLGKHWCTNNSENNWLLVSLYLFFHCTNPLYLRHTNGTWSRGSHEQPQLCTLFPVRSFIWRVRCLKVAKGNLWHFCF